MTSDYLNMVTLLGWIYFTIVPNINCQIAAGNEIGYVVAVDMRPCMPRVSTHEVHWEGCLTAVPRPRIVSRIRQLLAPRFRP